MNTNLRNVSFIGESLVSDNLEANLMSWLNWNLLGTSAFFNVNIPTSGSYGGDAHRLRLAKHSNYTNGQVWEGFRKQWVWQSGTASATQPIQISGVYVNGAFKPASGIGAYSFNIDYPNGRIIFNSAIATTATVTAEYSFNYYQLYNVDSPWWSEVQRNSFRVDDSSFLISASGIYNKPPEQRIQLPAIIVQATPNVSKEPYQLGNHAHWHRQDLRFYLLAETNRDLKWITDVLLGQYDAQLEGFDSARMTLSGTYPLDMNGAIRSNTTCYPDWTNNYPWKNIRIKDVRGYSAPRMEADKVSYPIFSATIQMTTEVLLN